MMGNRRSRIMILSGTTLMRYPTMLNHRIYADRHGYRYRFDPVPYRDIWNLYFHKIAAIRDALQDCEWLFWLDDDAAFMQMDRSLEDVVPEMAQDQGPWGIFCKSPINRGAWTYLSSGNFLIRNCPEAHALLEACLATDLAEVRAWWNADVYGLYTHGDQDALVYHIETNPDLSAGCLILDYTRFNTRPFHFEEAGQHFLVHFTNHPERSKRDQMRDFAQHHGLTDFLVPDATLAPYAAQVPHLLAGIGEA